jgi:hypothetical protein
MLGGRVIGTARSGIPALPELRGLEAGGRSNLTMEILCEAGDNLVMVRVNRTEVREQEVNARFQPPEMLERLAATIRSEPRLESVPFGVMRDGYIEVISGHHRIRGAVMAGVCCRPE